MFILETTACDSLSVLGTILFIKKLIKILSIIVPVILILLITIDITKAVIASSDDDMKKAQKLALKRLIAGLIVFFVPIIVDASFKLIDDNGVLDLKCYTDATDAKVEDLANQEKERQAEKEKERQEKLTQTKEAAKKKQQKELKLRQKAIAKAGTSSNSSSGSASSDVCTNCANSEKIAQTAELLAWKKGTSKSIWHHDYPRHKKWTKWSQLGKARPTQNFMNAYDKVKSNHWTNGCSKRYGCWPAIGASCDRFVFTVVKYSGYDKNFPTGLGSQQSYLPRSAKWKQVSKAKRGDVCISGGHIKIYLGNGKIAHAGYNTKKFGVIMSGGCSGYRVYRAK